MANMSSNITGEQSETAVAFSPSVMFILTCVRHKRKWTKHLTLLMNIMVCDCLTCIGGVLFCVGYIRQNIPGAGKDEILMRQVGCVKRMGGRLWDVGTNANLLGLFLMSVDHFLAVYWSLKHATLVSIRWIFAACAVAWTLAILLAFSGDMMIASEYVPNMEKWVTKGTTRYCYQLLLYNVKSDGRDYKYNMNQERNSTAKAWIDLVLIVAVFVVMCCVYVYIAGVVVTASRRKKALNDKFRATKQKMKGIGTTVLLLSSFLVLYLPTAIYIPLVAYEVISQSDVGTVLVLIVTFTAIVDVCIYGCRDKDVQKVLRCSSPRSRRQKAASLKEVGLLGDRLTGPTRKDDKNTSMTLMAHSTEPLDTTQTVSVW